MNRLRQHPSGEPLHVEIFYSNKTKLVDKPPRFFVEKVGALVDNVGVRSLKQEHCFPAAILAFGATGYLALAAPQPGFRTPVVPGILDLRTIGQYRKTVQTDVDTDFSSGCRQWLGGALHAETNEPAAGLALDGDRFDGSLQRPMQFDFDMPDSLHAQFSAIEQPTPVAVRRESNAVISAEGTKSREARLVSPLHAGKESLKGLIDPTEDILAAGEVRESQATIFAHRLQLVRLVVVIDRFAADLPGTNPLFEGGVIETGCFPQLAVEKINLRRRWIQPVFVRQAHVCLLSSGTSMFTRFITNFAVPERGEKHSAIAESLFRCRLKATVPEA
jgi:hypothetical protein